MADVHTLSLLVENKPGVLTRVTSLIARRGYNIASLAVDRVEDPTLSRVTIVVEADATPTEQIIKQLHKLVDVHKIYRLDDEDSVSRELALFKVAVTPEQRPEIISITNVYRARVLDISPDSMIIEATGNGNKLDTMEGLLREYGIKEIVRTGKVALSRGLRD